MNSQRTRKALADPVRRDPAPVRNGKLSFLRVAVSLALLVAFLYWGRPVLIPLALAVLLTFVLSPVVTLLRRCHLPHVVAVFAVVILAFSVLGVVLAGIGGQVNSLALELPRHQENIREKIHDLRGAFQSAAIDRVRGVFRDLRGEFNSTNRASTAAQSEALPAASQTERAANSDRAAAATATPPEAEADDSRLLKRLVGPVSELLVTAGLVIALVVFMLLRRDELRNRLILLGGLEQLPVTTRVLREAGQRISRYLLTYTLLNAGYGIVVGVGLHLIGVPYALLWGFFAAVMRFIPYVGPWVGALLPVLFSLAVFPGWVQPLLVIALYIVAELTSNMLLEPIFYGQSAGVSEVALLIALAFWVSVWGPIGLLLGTPLTVCLVVLAKYIPALEWFHLLIGDGPFAERCLIYYERVRSGNAEDAEEIVRNYVRERAPLEVCDELLLPALIFARCDRRRGRLPPEMERRILRSIRGAVGMTFDFEDSRGCAASETVSRAPAVAGISAGDEFEDLAFLMLQRSLQRSDVKMDIQRPDPAWKQRGATEQRSHIPILCVGALAPGAAERIEEITEALEDADVNVVTGHWGIGPEIDGRLARALGPEYSGSGLRETHGEILEALESRDAPPSLSRRQRPSKQQALSHAAASPDS